MTRLLAGARRGRRRGAGAGAGGSARGGGGAWPARSYARDDLVGRHAAPRGRGRGLRLGRLLSAALAASASRAASASATRLASAALAARRPRGASSAAATSAAVRAPWRGRRRRGVDGARRRRLGRRRRGLGLARAAAAAAAAGVAGGPGVSTGPRGAGGGGARDFCSSASAFCAASSFRTAGIAGGAAPAPAPAPAPGFTAGFIFHTLLGSLPAPMDMLDARAASISTARARNMPVAAMLVVCCARPSDCTAVWLMRHR